MVRREEGVWVWATVAKARCSSPYPQASINVTTVNAAISPYNTWPTELAEVDDGWAKPGFDEA